MHTNPTVWSEPLLQYSNRTGLTGLHRIDRILIVAEFPTPDHALTRPASVFHNKKSWVVVIFEVIPSQQWAIIRYYIGV